MAKLMTQKEFLERCNQRYGNEFNYSKVDYVNAKIRIIIKCKKHGWFSITPYKHLNNTEGCPKCGHETQGKNKTKTTEEFIKEAKKIHKNKYDYSLSIYTGCDDKIEIICKRHGNFLQRAGNHLWGLGCVKCGNLSTTKEFIGKARKIHNGRYDYSIVDYEHGKIPVCIICPIHGEFWQKPTIHTQGKGCPKCNFSKGELGIDKWLSDNDIKYETQKEFENCVNPKTGYKLRYDFFIPSLNTLIEYDGKQHFVLVEEWTKETKEKFENRKFKDSVKTKYADQNGFKLVRIKYTNFKKIDEILCKLIKK